MSTDIWPADPDPRQLHVHDPAELMAEARIALGEVPRDCLLLFGHDGAGTSPLVTRSDRRHLLEPGGREQLENHLELMRRHGCREAFAVIVLGDGHERVEPDVLAESIGRAGTILLTTARDLLPDPFRIHRLWVVGQGVAHELLLGQETEEACELWISPPRSLRSFEATRSAADAVLSGLPTPQDPTASGTLVQLGDDLHLRRLDPERTDPQALFGAARSALARLEAHGRSRSADDARETYVTDCEHLALLLSALAVDSLHWELLALCVEHGQGRPIDRDRLLQELTSDPERIPVPDVCAGGEWYVALEKLRLTLSARPRTGTGEQELLAADAWRGLTVILVLLAWWNHRFATAGTLVDELWEREPASTLAPLLARLTDEPIAPAWWPHR